MKISFAETDNVQSKSFKHLRQNGSKDYLFVLFKSPAKLLVDGNYVDTDWGSYIIFDKHKIQSYYPNNNSEFVHDFMHFDLESDDEKFVFSKIPKDKLMHFSLPHTISNVIAEIHNELNSPFIKYKEKVLSTLGLAFLLRIANELEKPEIIEKKEHFVQLYDLRSLIYQDPQTPWSVEKMCQKVCLSRSYFQHLYKTFFSISFSNDLINARINFAKKLLVSTMLNINEISEKCGYTNVEHFIRQFKKKTGVSPRNFRLMR